MRFLFGEGRVLGRSAAIAFAQMRCMGVLLEIAEFPAFIIVRQQTDAEYCYGILSVCLSVILWNCIETAGSSF